MPSLASGQGRIVIGWYGGDRSALLSEAVSSPINRYSISQATYGTKLHSRSRGASLPCCLYQHCVICKSVRQLRRFRTLLQIRQGGMSTSTSSKLPAAAKWARAVERTRDNAAVRTFPLNLRFFIQPDSERLLSGCFRCRVPFGTPHATLRACHFHSELPCASCLFRRRLHRCGSLHCHYVLAPSAS